MDFNSKKNSYQLVAKDNPKDRIGVVIGDDKEPDILLPQQKISRWDNENNVSIRLLDFDEYSVTTENEKVIFGNEKQEVHIYPITEGDGGQEFEVILNEKPKTNVIQFTLVDKDVEYFYQPELTKEEKDKGAVRPENVVGSYAVYAKSNKINYVGGKEYKCGKVGHIFRPQIVDANGNEVWGELKIENDLLTVTIPQKFLDNAVFPVRHAAGLTFGYTTAGASNGTSYQNEMNGYRFTGAAGTATGISMIGFGVFKRLLVTHSDHTILTNGITGAVAVYSTTVFTEGTFASNPTISAVDYDICFMGDGVQTYFYDTGTTNYAFVDASNNYGTPTNPTDGSHNYSYKFSIYCTYTAGGETTTSTSSTSSSSTSTTSSSTSTTSTSSSTSTTSTSSSTSTTSTSSSTSSTTSSTSSSSSTSTTSTSSSSSTSTTSTSSSSSTSTTSSSSSTSTTSTSSSSSTSTTSSSSSTSTTSTSSSSSTSSTSSSSSTSSTSSSSSTSSTSSSSSTSTTSSSTSTTSSSSSTSTTSTSSSSSTSTTSSSSSTSTTSTSSSSSTSTTSSSSSTSTSTTSSSTSTTSTSSSSSTSSTSSSSSTSTTSTSSSSSTSTTSTSISTSTTSSSSSTSTTSTSTSSTSSSSSTSSTSSSSSSSTSSTSSSTSTSSTSSSSSTSSTSSSSSTSSTSTSTSTTTTLSFIGCLAFGEESPTEGETPISWATWDGTGEITGDADWGKLQLNGGETQYSQVYDHGEAIERQYTIAENVYGTGQGDATLYYRGSVDSFGETDELPAWTEYTGVATETYRYFQIKEVKL